MSTKRKSSTVNVEIEMVWVGVCSTCGSMNGLHAQGAGQPVPGDVVPPPGCTKPDCAGGATHWARMESTGSPSARRRASPSVGKKMRRGNG